MQKILFLILTTFMVINVHGLASAHVLLTDGSIGAVLHIDPDDDPIVNQPSSFFFDFKDTTNRINLLSCDCQFEIFANGKQIYSQPIASTNKTAATLTYTFPARSIYTVKVVGNPTDGSSFSPFTLTDDVRVSRVADQPITEKAYPPYLIYILGICLIVLLVIFAIIKLRKDRISHENP